MDKKEILKQLGDLPEDIYDEIVRGFYEETRERLKALSGAVAVSNWPEIVRLAHGIKGSSANLRLIEIQAAAESLQRAAESNNQSEVSKSFELLKSLMP